MGKKADIGGKRLIGLAPDNWVRWVTQRDELEVREIIGSDFQWISRDNGGVWGVWGVWEDEEGSGRN